MQTEKFVFSRLFSGLVGHTNVNCHVFKCTTRSFEIDHALIIETSMCRPFSNPRLITVTAGNLNFVAEGHTVTNSRN